MASLAICWVKNWAHFVANQFLLNCHLITTVGEAPPDDVGENEDDDLQRSLKDKADQGGAKGPKSVSKWGIEN